MVDGYTAAKENVHRLIRAANVSFYAGTFQRTIFLDFSSVYVYVFFSFVLKKLSIRGEAAPVNSTAMTWPA